MQFWSAPALLVFPPSSVTKTKTEQKKTEKTKHKQKRNHNSPPPGTKPTSPETSSNLRDVPERYSLRAYYSPTFSIHLFCLNKGDNHTSGRMSITSGRMWVIFGRAFPCTAGYHVSHTYHFKYWQACPAVCHSYPAGLVLHPDVFYHIRPDV